MTIATVEVATPRDALVHELAAAIESTAPRLCEVPVRRGFPNSGSPDDVFELPAISVMASESPGEKSKRKLYAENDLGDGTVEQIFEVERLRMRGSVELWTGTKSQREPLEIDLDALFSGEAVADYGTEEPGPAGLVLVLSLLYDAKVRVRVMDKPTQDAGGGRDGYFRLVYSFECDVPRLKRVRYNKATFTTTVEASTDVEI